MKTLSNHTLVYDKDCPLCDWYTSIFLKYNLLDSEGRKDFGQVIEDNQFEFDVAKAKNKIALVNRENGVVTYGIDSMLKVLGHRFLSVRVLGRFAPIYWFLTQLYNFITYNRKIVIASDCNKLGSCVPSRNVFWRVFFIIFCGIMTTLIVDSYFFSRLNEYYIGTRIITDALIFIAQLAFQYIMCLIIKENNIYDYLGQVAFVSFLGALLLLGFSIGLSIFSWVGFEIQFLEVLCYGVVAAFMFFEHKRRVNVAGHNALLSWTWVLFRLLVYPFAFSLF
jgi:predicted DCC family thiol-disulfide oxidoreductase YuxK